MGICVNLWAYWFSIDLHGFSRIFFRRVISVGICVNLWAYWFLIDFTDLHGVFLLFFLIIPVVWLGFQTVFLFVLRVVSLFFGARLVSPVLPLN